MCKGLWDHGKQSVRRLAHKTGLAPSSLHRLQQALERRSGHPESWVWATEDGRQWLTRLVVAMRSTFGLKRGGGMDTLREFCARLRLETQVGCAPSALRGVRPTLEATMVEPAAAWEQEGGAAGEVRAIIGAVDETFLEQLIRIFMDVPMGDLLVEEVADAHPFATWTARVDKRLEVLGTWVLSLVSDRANALMQLVETGLECRSMPDVFHVAHDLVKSSALALGRRLRHAPNALKHAQEVLASRPALAQAAHAGPGRKAAVEAQQAEVTRWEEMQRPDRHHLETLALTRHPFSIADSAPQTSEQVASRLQAAVEAIEAVAERPQVPAPHDAIDKVRKP